MKKQLLTLILLISCCLGLQAQGSTFLTGYVTDADGVSTYDIQFIVNGVSTTFTSGSDGSFNEILDPAIDFIDSLQIDILFENCYGEYDVAEYEFFVNDLNQIEIIWFNFEYCGFSDFEGCTDPNASNYDPNVTIDDGSCEYAEGAENDLCADATPLENGIILVDNTNAFINEGMDGDCWGFGAGEAEQTSVWYSFTTPEEPVSVLIESMYDGTGSLTDTQFGLYLECGADMVECDGNTGEGLMAMFNFECGYLEPNTDYILQIDGWNADSGTCFLNFDMQLGDCVLEGGCLDCTAMNYNPDANYDDGSCEYSTSCEDGTYVAIELLTGSWAYEISFYINGELVIFPCVDGLENNTSYYTYVCLPDGCMTVDMYDSFGDGWNGGILFITAGDNAYEFGLDYGSYGSGVFVVNEGDCEDIYGCTYEGACNYNPESEVNDGSCTWPGCTDPEALNYYSLAGCGDDSYCTYPLDCADNESPIGVSSWLWINTTDTISGSYSYELADADGNVYLEIENEYYLEFYEDICLPNEGCYTITMTYSEDVSYMEGSIYIYGLDSDFFINTYISSESNVLTYEFSLDGSCGDVFGCTDEYACNYDADATSDNWTCTYPGCMDEDALNYDPWAVCSDDELCQYPFGCDEDQTLATLYICTFGNGQNVNMEILNEEGEVVASYTDLGTNIIMQEQICLDLEGCYTVVMWNTVETGWYGGYYWIDVDGVTVSTDYLDYELEEETTLFSLDGTCGPIEGCIYEGACNYDPEATTGDPIFCTWPGCMIEGAINYDPFAGCSDDTLCVFPEPCEANSVEVLMMTDYWGAESSWILYEGYGTDLVIVAQGNGYGSNTMYIEDLCLEDGCYLLEMYDTFGDGWGYGDTAGYIEFYYDGTMLFQGTIETGTFASGVFSINSDCSLEEVYGCTDPNAWNYNPEATIDDGTCEFEDYYGCTDPNAWNYNPEATIDDGSCEYEFILGCTDPDALNYDPFATIDDGSCYYFEYILGCTDPNALNYNPEANWDDGSCVYDEEEIDCEAVFGIFEIILEEDMIIIVNTSTGEDLNFFWDFGDGTTSTDPFPIHFYEEDGIYTVCLTVYNDDETCVDTFCTEIVYFSQEMIMEGAEDISTEDGNDGFTINIISEDDMETISVIEVDDFDFNIYPNPTSDVLNIQMGQFNPGLNIMVRDLSGRIILDQQMNDMNTQISLNNYSNGIYILSLQTEGQVYTKRFEIIR